MTQFYTYLHAKPDGTPFYVGKGVGRRSHEFRRRNHHHTTVVTKYGAVNIKVFMFPCDSEEQAFADEIQHIAQLRSEGYVLANYTDGGEGATGCKLSDVTKAKLSAANTGRKMSVESSRKKSTALKGCKMPPRSEESKIKAAIKQTGKKASVETKKKMSAARIGNQHLLGHVHTDNIRKKMSESHKGNKASLGFRHTTETRAKMSATRKGRVPWNKGVPRSQESNKKTSETLKKTYDLKVGVL